MREILFCFYKKRNQDLIKISQNITLLFEEKLYYVSNGFKLIFRKFRVMSVICVGRSVAKTRSNEDNMKRKRSEAEYLSEWNKLQERNFD